MRLVILFLAGLLSAFNLRAQKEKTYWYFGQGAGMAFDQPGQKPTILNGNTNTMLASTTASDPITGELLFYSDGKLLYNANHQVMQGSFTTNEETDDIQTVPVPGNKDFYFIFMTYPSKPRLLMGCIINMSKNGGLGEVVQPLGIMVTEVRNKFAVVPVCDGFWLITSPFGGQTTFAAKLVTSSSISGGKTVISTIGMSIEGQNPYAYDNVTLSPQGNKMAVAHGNFWQRNGYIEIFDFNKETGEFSNARAINPPNLPIVEGPYISNFSPDGRWLYYSCYCGGGTPLYQFDTEAPNIDGSRALVTDTRGFIHDLEIGPDKVLYILHGIHGRGDSTVDAMHFDNSVMPKYEIDYLKLTAAARYFPNFVNYFTNSIDFTYKTTCNKLDATFTCESNTTPLFVQFLYGDGSRSDWSPPKASYNHTYPKPGRYLATIKALLCPTGDTATITKEVIMDGVIQIDLGPDTTICPGSTLELNAGFFRAEYEWNTGDKTPTIEVTRPGIYSVKVGQGACAVYDTIKVNVWPEIWLALGKEYFICEEQSKLAKLDAGKGFIGYKWYPTGDSTQWIIARKTGEHYVIVKDFRGCEGQAGTEVMEHCPPSLYFPNVFSPGVDGLNDVFKPVAENITDYKIAIFNRWGEKVYEGNDLSTGWDGKFNDKNAPEGLYLYTAQYTGYQAASASKEKYFVKGVVTILR